MQITLLAHPWAIWILVAVAAGLLELMVPYFTFSFVSLAAVASALAAVWLGWEIQALVFVVAILVSVVLVRPVLLKRFHVHNHMPSRSQSLMGLAGVVTEEVDMSRNTDRVLVQGEDWSARSEQLIRVGSKIEVVGYDGIVLLVEETT